MTTFKSQDDIEPEMPAIGSEFQSNKYEEEPHNQDKIEEQSDYTELPQQLVTSPN